GSFPALLSQYTRNGVQKRLSVQRNGLWWKKDVSGGGLAGSALAGFACGKDGGEIRCAVGDEAQTEDADDQLYRLEGVDHDDGAQDQGDNAGEHQGGGAGGTGPQCHDGQGQLADAVQQEQGTQHQRQEGQQRLGPDQSKDSEGQGQNGQEEIRRGGGPFFACLQIAQQVADAV